MKMSDAHSVDFQPAKIHSPAFDMILMVSRYSFAVLVLFASGCEGDVDNAAWRGVPQVTGKVMLGSKPLAGATVSFHSAERNKIVATTDESGRYALNLTDEGESAIGKYAVRIRSTSTPPDGGDMTLIERVPANYNENTELVVDILDGENVIDFKLEASEPEAD